MADRSRVGARRRSGRSTLPLADLPEARERAAESAPQLDTLVHERTRLGIVSALAASPRLSFSQLRAILKASDGNVSAHARKLEEAGYILAHKRFEGRLPRTEYELTEAGRKALERYLNQMETLIESMRRH